MSISNKKIEQRLESYRIALENAKAHPELSALLALYTYNAAKIDEGVALRQVAFDAYLIQQDEYGEQYAATQSFSRAWDAAQKAYMRLVNLGRILFKNDHTTYTELGLIGDRKRTFSGWIAQAGGFFANLLDNPDALAKYAAYNVPQAEIEAARDAVDAAEVTRTAQGRETAEAQQATSNRDAAVDVIDAWMSEMTAIARIATVDNPQLMELLDVVV